MFSSIHDKGKSDKRKLEKYYADTAIELGNTYNHLDIVSYCNYVASCCIRR
jgi:hypothetical protein